MSTGSGATVFTQNNAKLKPPQCCLLGHIFKWNWANEKRLSVLRKQWLLVRVHFESHSLFFVSTAFSVSGKCTCSILVLSGLLMISLSFLKSTVLKDCSPKWHHSNTALKMFKFSLVSLFPWCSNIKLFSIFYHVSQHTQIAQKYENRINIFIKAIFFTLNQIISPVK